MKRVVPATSGEKRQLYPATRGPKTIVVPASSWWTETVCGPGHASWTENCQDSSNVGGDEKRVSVGQPCGRMKMRVCGPPDDENGLWFQATRGGAENVVLFQQRREKRELEMVPSNGGNEEIRGLGNVVELEKSSPSNAAG
ncbi:hypothetical protein AVEN_151403-1 [Araneus ventricosus]|uniref:Uncharacterized protein n=1 Tax=Araneus ventricosus TaxID=182803 RepID=A0A4Y2C935_ARAVE|nr:hypothetical protein AVEN_151403-1 [Araneus ventricosus]